MNDWRWWQIAVAGLASALLWLMMLVVASSTAAVFGG